MLGGLGPNGPVVNPPLFAGILFTSTAADSDSRWSRHGRINFFNSLRVHDVVA